MSRAAPFITIPRDAALASHSKCINNIVFAAFAPQDEIRTSNALIMTVPQAKGLEFDDVFLFNFFQDSVADASEWRVLNQFVEDVRERQQVCAATRKCFNHHFSASVAPEVLTTLLLAFKLCTHHAHNVHHMPPTVHKCSLSL